MRTSLGGKVTLASHILACRITLAVHRVNALCVLAQDIHEER